MDLEVPYRKLQIAWSLAWGVAAVLLCVLWVRSYWRVDGFMATFAPRFSIGIGVNPGAFGMAFYGESFPDAWTFGESTPTETWLASVVMPSGKPYPSRVWGVFDFHASDGVSFTAPFWFLIAVAAAVSAAPWYFPRFSLRTLLMVTTLVAVVLGLIVWFR